MNTHPEQQPNEIYLGNACLHDIWKSSWRSSRLGEKPLRADGSPYLGEDLKPWFIQRSEVEAAITACRFEIDRPGRAESIRVYEQMLISYK